MIGPWLPPPPPGYGLALITCSHLTYKICRNPENWQQQTSMSDLVFKMLNFNQTKIFVV